MLKRLKFEIDPLVNDMLDKIPLSEWESETSTFLDPAMGGAQYIRAIIETLREYGHSDENIRGRVFGIENSQLRVDFAVNKYGLIGTYISTDFLSWETDMKFDNIVGNFPYQKQVGPTKTEPIWDKFVKKSFELLKEDGYAAFVHPAGWRNVDGRYKSVQDIIKNKNLLYLKMYSESDAVNIFGVNIVFDYYILQNSTNKGRSTLVFHDGVVANKNISDMEFIPNKNFEDLYKLLAKENEPRVEVLHSWSAYETRKPYMSSEKTDEFLYPCVCNVAKSEECTLMFSSTNEYGHFGIPKLICGSASSGSNFFVDKSGDYGITQFSFGIVEHPDNLDNLKKALKSDRFREIIEAIPNFSAAINFKILSLFRKDFWKEFV